MGYAVTMTPSAHRMFRKLPPQIRKYLVKQALKLAKHPMLGEQLSGGLRAFRSLHTTCKGTHYRIVYEVNTKLQEIIIRGVGSRENFYKKLIQMRL